MRRSGSSRNVDLRGGPFGGGSSAHRLGAGRCGRRRWWGHNMKMKKMLVVASGCLVLTGGCTSDDFDVLGGFVDLVAAPVMIFSGTVNAEYDRRSSSGNNPYLPPRSTSSSSSSSTRSTPPPSSSASSSSSRSSGSTSSSSSASRSSGSTSSGSGSSSHGSSGSGSSSSGGSSGGGSYAGNPPHLTTSEPSPPPPETRYEPPPPRPITPPPPAKPQMCGYGESRVTYNPETHFCNCGKVYAMGTRQQIHCQ